jgi:hypothetical protein
MAKFEPPIFIKPTDPFEDVIAFGKSPEAVANDSTNGVARFGGPWRSPNYVLAYMKIAAIVINHGVQAQCLDEVALPAFYMQRHTLELFLKRLLSWLYEIAELHAELGQDNRGVPSKGQIERFRTKHHLALLWQDLQMASVHYSFGEPPLDIEYLVRQIENYEVTETWSRYESAVRRNGTVIHHVKDEIELPLVELSSR